MVEAGNDSVVMEATSHALALGRTRNCRFDVGVVTTVTSEHLEFHGTVEAYRAAKALLVEEAPIAVLNADDSSFGYFRERARPTGSSRMPSTPGGPARRRPARRSVGDDLHLESPRWHGEVRVAMPGRFNVSNALAALGVVEALGLDVHHASMALETTPGSRVAWSGSMPASRSPSSSTTPTPPTPCTRCCDPPAADEGPADRRLRLGGRARPDEARADGPRRGRIGRPRRRHRRGPAARGPARDQRGDRLGRGTAGAVDGERLWVIDDRREAIAHAIGLAREGDLVLLAGKGHETSIFYGTEKRPWDDRAVAREALAAAGWGSAGG